MNFQQMIQFLPQRCVYQSELEGKKSVFSIFITLFSNINCVIITILQNKQWPHEAHKMFMGLIIAILQCVNFYLLYVSMYLQVMLQLLWHFMILLYIILFQSFISTQLKHQKVDNVNCFNSLWSFFPRIPKASLFHMQPCTVFKSITFQGLHLNSTRLYKLEPCFSLQHEVDKKQLHTVLL